MGRINMMVDSCSVRGTIFAAGCALTLVTALGGQAHAESLEASYTISFARIRVGDITATVVFSPTEYAMSARGRAGGLMKALMDVQFEATSRPLDASTDANPRAE
jgi:hypothetical protein